MSDSAPIRAGQPVSTRLDWGSRSREVFSLPEAGRDSSTPNERRAPEPRPSPTPFTDPEIDQLIKKMGLKPEENLRQAVRFLIQHHFNLDRPLLEMANQLRPEGPWEDHGPAEALMAALSRCPLEDVEASFRILMSAFTSKHPTVMSLLQNIVAQLQDLTSQWLVDPEKDINPSLMVDALDEEILQWKAVLDSPSLQLHLIVQRGELLTQLRRLHLFLRLSLDIMQMQGSSEDKPIIRQLRSLTRDIRHAVELIYGDMVLSKQDNEHHFTENGQCSTLGLWVEGEKLPCRLWAESDGMEGDEEGEQAWKFRFHWHDELLQHLEAEVEVYKSECEIQFHSDSPETRQILDEQSENLAAKIRALGFEPTLGPAKIPKPSRFDPQAELHVARLTELKHVDSEA